MENLRAFEVKYLGPTNSRGSRVKIEDLRFNKSKTISYDYQFNDAGDIAENYLKSIGIKVAYCSEAKIGYILTTKNFTKQLA